jgi:hypothetical protein
MSNNNDHKSSPMERLSDVAAEMARPRVVESTKSAESASAGEEDSATTPSATETPAPPDRSADLLKHAEFIPASINQIPG